MKTKSVKMHCYTCEGKKTIEEIEYQTDRIIKIVCPECSGRGFHIVDEVLE